MKRLFVLLLLLVELNAEEVGDIINKVNAATVNTLLIFTSQEGLNSGKYTFTKMPTNVNMDIYHLPFTYNFASDTDINYFIVGNTGYSRVYLDDKRSSGAPSISLDSFNQIQTYTAGIGGGIKYKPSKDLSISGGLEVIYSSSGISIKETGGPISDFFNKNNTDNISYKIFTLLEYRPIVYDFKPYVTLGYKLFETKSELTVEKAFSFTSESSVASLSLGVESPKLYSFDKQNITLEGYIIAHYLGGTVREVVQFETYRSIGAVAYYNTPAGPWWASRFFIEANTVNSQGLEGYNFGIGFTIDF